MKSKAVLWSKGAPDPLVPTSIKDLVRDSEMVRKFREETSSERDPAESFLENLIAESPGLLELESVWTGIRGRFEIFSQLPLLTPRGRTVYPDLILVCQSGDVVVVEVKLQDNDELKDRRVIGQILEYAASLRLLKEEDLFDLFRRGATDARTLPELVEQWFPESEDPRELSAVIARRCQDGDLHLIIACDRAPAGARSLCESVSQQSSLPFHFQVKEILPLVADGRPDLLVLMPSTAAQTEIVGRTVVHVEFVGVDSAPTVEIKTTSASEIGNAIEKTRRRVRGDAVEWTYKDLRAHLESADDLPDEHRTALLKLLDFAREESFEGKITTGPTERATFSFWLKTPDESNASKPGMLVWNYCYPGNGPFLYPGNLRPFLEPSTIEKLGHQLQENLGIELTPEKAQMLRLNDLALKVDAFLELMTWLKQVAGGGAP